MAALATLALGLAACSGAEEEAGPPAEGEVSEPADAEDVAAGDEPLSISFDLHVPDDETACR